jgi:hypothetical protein
MNIDLSNINIVEILTHAFSGGLFFFLLKQYKTWSDIRERNDALWEDYCYQKDIKFIPAGGK